MMISSRWQKQDASIRITGLVITTAIFLFLSMLFLSLGLEKHWLSLLISTLVWIVGFTLTFTLKNRCAKSMIRILKFDYEAIERDFRMVFNDNHIRFYRKIEEDSYSYKFPGHSLIMTIQPYVLHTLVFDRQMTTQPATQVMLHKLNAKNKAFAEMLAESIDKMANQRASNWNKA